MPTLVAFTGLPFGLREGLYEIKTPSEIVRVHVSEQRYTPVITITSRPELAQSIPTNGLAEGWTSYTWYDHPFVLRVAFGRNVASLGTLNSCATVARPLPGDQDIDKTEPLIEPFGELALMAFNNLIAVVRRKARLYQVFDLRREDIDISIRNDGGKILREDPLQATLVQQEQRQTESFDLVQQSDDWYQEVQEALQVPEPVSLAQDLLMEAERALGQRFPRQAIATSHTAIETAASSLLNRGMTRRSIPNDEIDAVLSTRSLVAKLDVLLRTYAGFSLKHDNHNLWKRFNQLSDMRNDIVHRGKRPSTSDAELAILIAREVVSWLGIVRQRNK
jgi:hypothetical protein